MPALLGIEISLNWNESVSNFNMNTIWVVRIRFNGIKMWRSFSNLLWFSFVYVKISSKWKLLLKFNSSEKLRRKWQLFFSLNHLNNIVGLMWWDRDDANAYENHSNVNAGFETAQFKWEWWLKLMILFVWVIWKCSSKKSHVTCQQIKNMQINPKQSLHTEYKISHRWFYRSHRIQLKCMHCFGLLT